MENEKTIKTEQNIYNLLTNKPIEFSILIEKKTILDRILKRNEKTYKIKSLVLNDYIRIAELFDKCKELIIPANDNDLLVNSINSIIKYQNEILEIIAIFLNEKKTFLKNNLTAIELQKLIIKIIEFNDFSQFFFRVFLK